MVATVSLVRKFRAACRKCVKVIHLPGLFPRNQQIANGGESICPEGKIAGFPVPNPFCHAIERQYHFALIEAVANHFGKRIVVHAFTPRKSGVNTQIFIMGARGNSPFDVMFIRSYSPPPAPGKRKRIQRTSQKEGKRRRSFRKNGHKNDSSRFQ